jgi:hypothetical protein
MDDGIPCDCFDDDYDYDAYDEYMDSKEGHEDLLYEEWRDNNR